MADEPKLLDQVRNAIRTKHFSRRTEEAYCLWTRRFVLFHGKRHPRELGEAEIRAFLSHLATDQDVAASTQNQVLARALLSGEVQYHHRSESGLQKAVKEAVGRAS